MGFDGRGIIAETKRNIVCITRGNFIDKHFKTICIEEGVIGTYTDYFICIMCFGGCDKTEEYIFF